MSSIRVTSSGPSAMLGAAMIPVPAPDARAYQARGLIHGNPSQRIPVPYPGAVRQEITPLAIGAHDSRSSDAPSYFTASIYYLHGRQAMTPPVSVTSDNQLPVPAIDPRGRPAVLSARPVFLRQQQIVQPRVAARFPGRNRKARSG